MKTRSDFVTNSSSSSFVAYGTEMSKILPITMGMWLKLFYKEMDYYKPHDERMSDKYEKMKALETDRDRITYMQSEYADAHIWDYCDLFSTELLEVGGNTDWRDFKNMIIGIPVGVAKNKLSDVAMGEINQRVADEINRNFGTNLVAEDIYLFEESWYNG